MSLGVSLCLPVDDQVAGRVRVMTTAIAIMAFTGVGLLALGGIVFAAESVVGMPWGELAGGWLGVSGMFLMICFIVSGVARHQRAIFGDSQRLDAALFRPGNGMKQYAAELEDFDTRHRSKLFAEDYVIVAINHGEQCVLIEGAAHRYLIRAEDVTQIVDTSNGVGICYRVASTVELKIALSNVSPWAYLMRSLQNGSRDRALLRDVLAALDWEA